MSRTPLTRRGCITSGSPTGWKWNAVSRPTPSPCSASVATSSTMRTRQYSRASKRSSLTPVGSKAARTAVERARPPVTESYMNHVLSTHVIANHRLNTVWLDKIWNAGVPAVEIFCARQHIDWRDAAQIRELASFFRDADLKLHSIHTPIYNDEYWGRSGPQAALRITEPGKGRRNTMVDEIKRSIEIAEQIPFRYAIQHLGVAGEEYDDRAIDAAFTALDEICSFARQRGVEVLLENIPNALASSERLNLFNEQTHLKLK